MLGFIGINMLMGDGYSYSLLGTTLTLIVDTFFALRYEEMSDTIEFTPLELFSM